jgi:U32 family peptidase
VASRPDDGLPELLMPAGGFDAALAAIEGGADALYLGFGDFSARKQARNFDRLEYRRLHRLARTKGIRLYAALNTIVLEDELAGASSLLAFLGRFPPDAILVQDWGLARLIRERHPGIAIHASTQAALQGAEALRLAREMGASRVVLPRETSIAETARLRAAVPDVELEAFVHGALCYSFSGLCLASGLILGRSGNRGECAQLCRSYYDLEVPGPHGGRAARRDRGYWFSCRDLYLGERLAELAGAGVASLKVEGRMKSPEYCLAVARLYRGHLDRLRGAGPTDEEMGARLVDARLAFAREPTEGWAFERGGGAIMGSEYPGHRGIRAGRVFASRPGELVLDLEASIGLRDGLLAFERGDSARPVSFAVAGLRDAGSGRELRAARAGGRVAIDAPAVFKAGDEVRKVSSRDLDRKAASPEEFEPERSSIPARLFVAGRRLSLELTLPRFDGLPGRGGTATVEAGDPLPFERGRASGGFERAAVVFAQAGEADFRLEPSLEGAKVEAGEGEGGLAEMPLADAFLPPSILKREKNRAYARASELLAAAEADYAAASASIFLDRARAPSAGGSARPAGPGAAREGRSVSAPPRSRLTFPREGLPSGIAFATPRILREGARLPEYDGVAWLPLAPLVAERDSYSEMVADRVAAELESRPLRVGLGAIHHVALARGLRGRHPEAARAGRLSFFLDFNLYAANRLALISLDELVGGAAFAYSYIEGSEEARLAAEEGLRALAGIGSAPPLVPCGEDFEPPLFQSLACFLKHDVATGRCPPDCPRDWSGLVSDRDRRYRVVVEDCVTAVYRISRRQWNMREDELRI